MNHYDHRLRFVGRVCKRRHGFSAAQAFTLAEVMVANCIFAMVMGSILVMFVSYSRGAHGVNRQLEMDSNARVLYFLGNEIKSAQQVALQNYNGSSFTTVATNQVQRGNALTLTVLTGLTNTYQVFYWVNASSNLYRSVGSSTKAELCLNNITNALPFTFTSIQGSVLSSNSGQSRAALNVNLFMLDTNTKNFRQNLMLNTSLTQRN